MTKAPERVRPANALSSSATPSPAGRLGRVTEPLMRMPPVKSLSFLVALALVPTGCFDPLVTEDAQGGSATDEGETAGDATDGTSTEPTTTSEPDGSSGTPEPMCGNGIVEGDEACDDGVNDGSYGGCNVDCTAPGPFCGDGVVNGEEPCDDGDGVDGNGCNVDCVVSGTVLWTVTYDGPDSGADLATAVAVDSADNVVVVGASAVGGAGWSWVAKYSPDGDELWSVIDAGDAGESYANDVAVLPDDDIVAVGYSDNGSGGQNAWIRRYSADGDVVWTQTHAGATGELDSAEAVVADADGNVYVVIREGQVSIDNGTIHMIRKYTSDGQELWTVYEPEGISILDIALLPTGSLLVAAREGTPQLWTPVLEERNSDGGLVWQTVRDDLAPGWFSSVAANASGEVALSLSIQGENNSRIFHLGADFQEIWSGSPWGFDAFTGDVTIDDLGWIAATGGGGEDFTFWTRKYLPDGEVAWTDTYNGLDPVIGIDQGEGITRDSLGNVISVGAVYDDEATYIDARIRKFAP